MDLQRASDYMLPSGAGGTLPQCRRNIAEFLEVERADKIVYRGIVVLIGRSHFVECDEGREAP